MKIYSKLELDTIANALNILIKNSDKTKGVIMNVYHFKRFASRTHHIDYHEGLKKFKVYKHYKGYTYNDEILSDNQCPTYHEQMLDALIPLFESTKQYNEKIHDQKQQ